MIYLLFYVRFYFNSTFRKLKAERELKVERLLYIVRPFAIPFRILISKTTGSILLNSAQSFLVLKGL